MCIRDSDYAGHRFTRCGGQVLTIARFFSPVYVTFSAYHVLARSVVCEYSDPLDIGLAVSPSSSDCVAFLARTPTSPKHPLIVCEGPVPRYRKALHSQLLASHGRRRANAVVLNASLVGSSSLVLLLSRACPPIVSGCRSPLTQPSCRSGGCWTPSPRG